MPTYRKHTQQIQENHRRRCEDTGTVKQDNYRYMEIPANWTSPKRNQQSFEDIPGIVIKNYHTLEGAESVHGEGTFTNSYTEDDFLKL